MLKLSRLFGLIAVAISLLLLSGCERQPTSLGKLVEVQGEVLLDQRPVAGARVLFVPENPEVGEPFVISWGETNVRGEFELSTRDKRSGAMVGKHRVYISQAKFSVPVLGAELESDEQSREAQASKGQAASRLFEAGLTTTPSQKLAVGEQIPFFYNLHSELSWKVMPGGGIQRMKFELSSTDPKLSQ